MYGSDGVGVAYITVAFLRDSGLLLKHAKQNSDTTKGVVLLDISPNGTE
jgi:hypothetical protein